MKNKEVIRAIKFTLFSISAGAIELILFTILDSFTNLSYWACYLPALVASVIWNFTLNRNFTFKSANNVPIAMAKVFLFYLIFTPTSTVFGNYLAETLRWNSTIVTLIKKYKPSLIIDAINTATVLGNAYNPEYNLKCYKKNPLDCAKKIMVDDYTTKLINFIYSLKYGIETYNVKKYVKEIDIIMRLSYHFKL